MKPFEKQAVTADNALWENCNARLEPIDRRQNEIRSNFWRDYNRILHSKAYRRLKHKTQVFHATQNDHVCTRIEHVQHVCSVSYSIAQQLGLNTELALAIGIGHDIGHAPFGHDGEKILNQLAEQHYQGHFWHEGNGLFFADKIEMLQNENGTNTRLNLTYAVRDGIISHCGEVDQNSLYPRNEYIDLYSITRPNQYPPYTWEACIVKIADKISYLGRDLEDAQRLKILGKIQLEELNDIRRRYYSHLLPSASNTALIHNFAIDLCQNSTPQKGICFSEECFQTINAIKEFNYRHIYSHPRLAYYRQYAGMIITSVFHLLNHLYKNGTPEQGIRENEACFPKLIRSFHKWLDDYTDYNANNNNIIYSVLDNQSEYQKSIIGFISSMSDYFAIEIHHELISFE
ncbi:MAG: HD domain-containing protein [Bacteroidales bacterium]|nr:HD domain-containing protein [Bacteroidales bacterium]